MYVRSCYYLPLVADVALGAGSAASQRVPYFEPWRNCMAKSCVQVSFERCQVHPEDQPDSPEVVDYERVTTI